MSFRNLLPVVSFSFGAIVLGLVLALTLVQPTPAMAPVVSSAVEIYQPTADTLITSPLVVSGMAPGSWFFEATLPVSLVDETGSELARSPAQAQSDWMTEGPVPFLATLMFKAPASATGYLVVQNDNPSGLPEYSKSFSIKVRFE